MFNCNGEYNIQLHRFSVILVVFLAVVLWLEKVRNVLQSIID